MKLGAYYNEHDAKAASWLRELIKAGLIADGEVDERSILDVRGKDLEGFVQCHFFAGIGGWSYALRLAGWLDCALRASGRRTSGSGCAGWPSPNCPTGGPNSQRAARGAGGMDLDEAGATRGGLEQPHGHRWQPGQSAAAGDGHGRALVADGGFGVGLGHAAQRGLGIDGRAPGRGGHADEPDAAGGVEHADAAGRQGDRSELPRRSAQQLAAQSGAWAGYDLLSCLDGKARRVESGTFPLADGVPGRVGLLRGYGNAIVPQVAAEFITACCELRV